jgi:prevent-host-death family protein
MRIVTAAQANREFSKLLGSVRAGETILITSRGEAVATLAPPDRAVDEMEQAKAKLLTRLDKVEATHIPPWTRDELYD